MVVSAATAASARMIIRVFICDSFPLMKGGVRCALSPRSGVRSAVGPRRYALHPNRSGKLTGSTEAIAAREEQSRRGRAEAIVAGVERTTRSVLGAHVAH